MSDPRPDYGETGCVSCAGMLAAVVVALVLVGWWIVAAVTS